MRGGPQIHIRTAADWNVGAGRDCFDKALVAARTTTGFDKVTHIVIATDCDADSVASFDRVRAQIAKLAPALPVPAGPNVTAVGAPSVTVMMVPTDASTGSVESLVFRAASTVNSGNAEQVEALASRTGVPAWLPQKQAKMKVRSFIACTHEPRPDIGLGNLWIQGADHLVPMDHEVFNHLYNSLRTFFP